MKYCSKCKKIYFDFEGERCPSCNRKLIDEPNHFSPVYIITANGFELERIRAALESADIPYSYQNEKRETGIRILNSAPPENCEVFVPVSAYQDAVDVLVGIGAITEDNIPEINKDDIEKLNKTKKEAAKEEEELSPGKARIIRIFSFIGFLLILAATVYFADVIVALVKNFFA